MTTPFDASDWIHLVQHELFLFAGVFFLLGALDEFAIDFVYAWLRLTGRAGSCTVSEAENGAGALRGTAAVFIPTWQEAMVVAPTLRHALSVWPQDEVRLYVGCYRNDAATLASAMVGAAGDPRVRIVVHDREGPTSKADCLNRLYRALEDDEQRAGEQVRMVVLHDAEDMVDPRAITLLDEAMEHADFVQLPVIALPQSGSRWIAGHYSDEFAEAHAKAMVVRDALGAGIPGAGVGCAFTRPMLAKLVARSADGGPFPADSLTEDYELGLGVKALGGTARFLRVRTPSGRLVGTRAYFPARAQAAVRQKTRWIQGIALQGWDRLGWSGSPVQMWMQLRDRRGPFAAILLALAYLLVAFAGVSWSASTAGLIEQIRFTPLLTALLIANFCALLWRAGLRMVFTAREFGWVEGLLALPRIFVSNWIAILAGRRALTGYIRSLRGAPAIWDKTEHFDHPALAYPRGARA